jgi:hypothetical protein
MKYDPKVNDYVKWNNSKGVEGWVYFKGTEYITIEMGVRPKDSENLYACSIHTNERLLVLCYKSEWNQLEYVRSRESIHET